MFCNHPGLLQESLGPFGPEVSRECPSGCLGGPSGPGLRSVQKVSPECPESVPGVFGHLFDTLGTLWGHFLDTPEPGARRAPETPRGTLPGHFGPRDSCSRLGGLQRMFCFCGWKLPHAFCYRSAESMSLVRVSIDISEI